MIIALSRFGTFSGLSTTHSSTTDEYPGTPTFTFYGSSYRSKYSWLGVPRRGAGEGQAPPMR